MVCVGQHGGKQTGEASEDLMVSLAVVRVLRDQFMRLVQTVPVPTKQSGISSAYPNLACICQVNCHS